MQDCFLFSHQTKKRRCRASNNLPVQITSTSKRQKGEDILYYALMASKHVTLSYQWDDQKLVNDIYNYLTENMHMKVWMDIHGEHLTIIIRS